ncbi:MAG: hypothetical protein NC231_07270 [Bacillus sp. (in: Bacteria)]|nr:hypothetical protein [Bacillus sp. (in: firmicutes)]MCM1426462.1 hypothetical protein [Eubacterium sp.]
MYDFLKFIDSPDIREYNKDTQFTPAEWAVLISNSMKRTVDEKMEALQYLLDHYQENEFGDESVNFSPPAYPHYETNISFREVVRKTIWTWNKILEDRNCTENVIFEASFYEKGYDHGDSAYFASYEKAYAFLEYEKKHYLDDEDLKDVETYGRIERIQMENKCHDSDYYIFDTNMQMVSVGSSISRGQCDEDLEFGLSDDRIYKIFVPLPFKKGDIVRVDDFFDMPYYGVISCDWERPEQRERIENWISLDTYNSERDWFDYTDGFGCGDEVLNYSFCPDEELPDDQQVLKLIRDVRKGNMDFYTLLHKYSVKELDRLYK